MTKRATKRFAVESVLSVVKQAVSDALDAAGKGLDLLKTFDKNPAKALVQLRLVFKALSGKDIGGQQAFFAAKVVARTEAYHECFHPLVKSPEWKLFCKKLKPILVAMEAVTR